MYHILRTRKIFVAVAKTRTRLGKRLGPLDLGKKDFMMTDKTETTDAPIVIKKYANRRLYNTQKSSYVTLDHLAEMVRAGQDFVVKDAKSGDDITRSVLTQIIFEEESKGHNMLPTNFLRQLIGLYGDQLQGFVPGYLDASMETFSQNQDSMRAQMQNAVSSNPAVAGFETLARTNMEWFENAMRMFTPPTTPESAPVKEEATSTAKDVELGELKDQLAQMQEQLSKLVDKS